MHIKKYSDVLKMIDTKKNSFDILITQGAGSVSAVTELIKNKWKN
jgi:UDP-N-acetylmuramate-alanine ligase